MTLFGIDLEYADTATVKKATKASEKVLVVPRKFYEQGNDFDICVDYYGEYKTRGSSDGQFPGVETDKQYLQVIPYFVFVHNGKILTYIKNKSSGESRLHGLYSIGIGGHVNEKDGTGMKAVRQAAMRECHEEIGVLPGYTAANINNDNYIIIDIAGNAADFHIGFCQVITEWHPEELTLSKEVAAVEWLTPEQLQAKELEEWSGYILPLLLRDWGDLFA